MKSMNSSILTCCLFGALLSIVSCTADVESVESAEVDASVGKILNTPVVSNDDALLVYVDPQTVLAIDSAMPNALSDMATQLGASAVEHAIDMVCDVERRKA